MKYSRDWLIEKFEQEDRLKYIFFWGHQPKKNGEISSSCFSQWWNESFEADGVIYKTAEHWMMAEKAKLFGDDNTRDLIINSITPGEAKKLGRQVKGFDELSWNEKRFSIVVRGNYHKFSQNPPLKNYLLKTQDRILVEASPVDSVWGIGLAKEDKRVENPNDWKGLNLLGFALMEVRDQLKEY